MSSDSPAQRSVGYRAARFVWRRTAKPTFAAIRETAHVLRNTVMSGLSRADYKRWTSDGGLEVWWDERTRILASLIPPDVRVIEFGAGRRQLERYLPAGCTYIPSDLVDRGPGTVVLDLNRRPLPDLSELAAEVAVFGGVLEYIRDVQEVIEWLVRLGVRTCIASFDPVPTRLDAFNRYREYKRRSHNGYMNHLTEEELLQSFKAAGFACKRKQAWTRQLVLELTRV